MQNYFNYFTEIEEHFQRRRGTALLLSSLDWALIESWKDAQIPLEAVLRGIDSAFEKFERRKTRTQKVNGLAYCVQAVLTEAEQIKEASVGLNDASREPALPANEITAYLRRNATRLRDSAAGLHGEAQTIARETATRLDEIAEQFATKQSHQNREIEDLERNLTVLEEKLLAALTTSASESDLLGARAEADRELAPYRRSMSGAQIEQLQKQFLHKRLLEGSSLPRLSLFYM